MKICFAVNNMNSGGAERVVANLANIFVSNGHDVSILMVSASNTNSFYPLDKSIDLSALINSDADKRVGGRIKSYKRFLLKNRPDVVLSFLPHVNIYSSFVCKKMKIPVVLCERTDPASYSLIYRILLKISFRKADGCIFQTPDAMRFYGKKIERKSVIFVNPVKLDFVPPPKILRKKQIVAVGRLIKTKNYYLLIDSFAEFNKVVKGYSLNIYGEGPLKNDIETYIRSLGLDKQIILKGNSKTWQQESFDSHFYVLTSNYEGMPNALLESLSIGLPSISTDCRIGGPKFISSHSTRLCLVNCNDKTSLVAAMIETSKHYVDDIYDGSFYDFVKIENVYKYWIDYLKKIIRR